MFKKKLMVVFLLGSIGIVFGPPEGAFTPPFETQPTLRSRITFHVKRINRALRAADESIGAPMRKYNNFILDSAKGFGRLIGVPPHILDRLEPLRIQPLSGGASGVAGESDVASLQSASVAEVAAIRAEGRPTVSFADRFRSLFGRTPKQNAPQTFTDLNSEIDRIDKQVGHLRSLMRDQRRNPLLAKEVLRLLEVRDRLNNELVTRPEWEQSEQKKNKGSNKG